MYNPGGGTVVETFLDHVWVYRFMYVVVNWDPSSTLADYKNSVLKITGFPTESGTEQMSMTLHLSIWISDQNIQITRMQSLE